MAVVIGAGPAGASAALGLLRSGVGVTLLEERAEPGPRVCGGFLDGEALRHLAWLGFDNPERELGASGVASVRVTTDRGADQTVAARPAGAALPRPALERALMGKAVEAGAHLRQGTRATGVTRTERGWLVSLAGSREALCADIAVLADGRFSGRKPADSPGGWYGWNASFLKVRQSPGEMSLHFYPLGYVGVLTFADGRTNICGLYRREDAPPEAETVFMAARTQNPAFDALMGGARRETPWQGAGPLPFSRGLRRSDGPLRAGDAAAVGDPFMGEGIGRALSAGPMIHAALQAAGPGPGLLLAYESLWRKAYGARLRLGWALRTILNWPALSGPLLTRLLRHPDLAGRLPPLFHGGFS